MVWQVGNIEVRSVYEQELLDIEDLIPESRAHKKQVPWLRPYYMDKLGNLTGVIQSFVVKTHDAVVLVDTCVGNKKSREHVPEWHMRSGDFLQRLEAIGVSRDKVSHVLCTHMHPDHVGWNTMLQDGVWKPTFPHARYLFSELEFNFWNEQLKHYENAAESDDSDALQAQVMKMMSETQSDSIQPLVDSGQVELVSTTHTVCSGISLLPTPGHTPGHVSILLESGGQKAIITGDCLHHPIQIAFPELGTTVDTDSREAEMTRRRLLEKTSSTHSLLIGSHFSSPCAVRVVSDGNEFKVENTDT